MSTMSEVHITTFGFSRGAPPLDALVYDCRALRNPHRPDRTGKTGLDEDVFNEVADHELFNDLVDHIVRQVGYRAFGENKQLIKIAIGCTMGRHRSVAVAFRVATILQYRFDMKVLTQHRDMNRDNVVCDTV